ncbi:MAG: hypothetical protein WD509_00700 [Candidatus Paceibacterota bacterium]
MSKNSALILFGSLIIIVSFLGIPSSWKTVAFSILGVLVVTLALLLRKDITSGALCLHLTEEKRTDSYAQSGVLRTGRDSKVNEETDESPATPAYEKDNTEIHA